MVKVKRKTDNAIAKKRKANDEDVLPMTLEQSANKLNHLSMEYLMKKVDKDASSLPAVAIIFKERHLDGDKLCLTNKDGIFLINAERNKVIIDVFGDEV